MDGLEIDFEIAPGEGPPPEEVLKVIEAQLADPFSNLRRSDFGVYCSRASVWATDVGGQFNTPYEEAGGSAPSQLPSGPQPSSGAAGAGAVVSGGASLPHRPPQPSASDVGLLHDLEERHRQEVGTDFGHF